MQNKKSLNLRDCPFCGKPGSDYEIEIIDNEAYCNCCGVATSVENWNTRPIEDELHQRIDELEAENKSFHDLLNRTFSEVIAEEVKTNETDVSFLIKHPMFTLFSIWITEAFIESGAMNFLETRIMSDKLGPLMITVQRQEGKSPADIIAEKQTRLGILNRRIENRQAEIESLHNLLIQTGNGWMIDKSFPLHDVNHHKEEE